MRTSVKLAIVLALVVSSISAPSARTVGPAFSSIGPLTFGANGALFAADRQAATIFALDLAGQATGSAPGTKDVANIDQKVAAMLGTGATGITITDLAVHPTSKNTFLSVMRGQGPEATPVIVRIDGAGKIDLVALETVKFTSVTLPNPAASSGRNTPVTDMALSNGRLYVSGMSNEEFASKVWSVTYPFQSADRGASVEIYHGNHDAVETRSPVMAFVPYVIDNQAYVLAGYTCTPLVKFPVSALKPGDKVRGTTIAEFGAGNQPIDMVVYKKDGKEFLLMTNSRHGVLKVATAPFAAAEPITTKVTGTGGVPFEKVGSMPGFIEQLDMLDATHSVVIARLADGAKNLTAVILP